jgi:hypothetical protein
MALDNLIRKKFVVLSVLGLVCLIRTGCAQSPTNEIPPCQTTCKATYQGPDEGFCYRGCRFMSILEFINGDEMTLEEVRDACLKACSDAYGMTNASSCAFGCQSQLPAIQDKRKQMAQFTMDMTDADPFGLSARFFDYSQRMMSCMLDQLNHQVTYGWMVITSSSSLPNGGQVVVIRGTPIRILHRADAIQEYKTSNYVETNLAVVDGGATPDVKSSQLVRMDNMMQGAEVEAVGYQQVGSDWLSCLSIKSGLSKMSLLLLFFTMLILLMWFFVGFLFPSSHSHTELSVKEKLSIYGDLEYLMPIDTKVPLTFNGSQKLASFAQPLPVKMQEI